MGGEKKSSQYHEEEKNINQYHPNIELKIFLKKEGSPQSLLNIQSIFQELSPSFRSRSRLLNLALHCASTPCHRGCGFRSGALAVSPSPLAYTLGWGYQGNWLRKMADRLALRWAPECSLGNSASLAYPKRNKQTNKKTRAAMDSCKSKTEYCRAPSSAFPAPPTQAHIHTRFIFRLPLSLSRRYKETK